jgi:hypothetical protein
VVWVVESITGAASRNFLLSSRRLFIALMLLLVVVLSVLRVPFPILGIVRVLPLLGLLILLAVFVLGLTLLILGHRGLLTVSRYITRPEQDTKILYIL